MKITDLAQELQISVSSIKRFILDFDLDIDECLTPEFDVKPEFEKFAKENKEFLSKYENDLDKTKSLDDIASKIKQPKEKIEEILTREMPQVFENGMYKSSVSSFGIDNKLGGNYNFVYDYFGHKTPLEKKDFIGYRDLFFYISEVLEPFINKEETKNWGIQKPAGIIMYGPPGSGKIFWANKISQIIGYEFNEIKKHYLSSTFINGNNVAFNDFLVSMLKKEKVELFLEEFDTVMQVRNADYSKQEDVTKEIILHYISKFEQENLLMVGSANTISEIDEEILAPGRFDVLIPIFPPNVKERTELIRYAMTKRLEKDATLYKILVSNNADHLPFWNVVAEQMKTFSNTMVIDFTQSLKKRIRAQYQKERSENLTISQTLLEAALRDAKTKLTGEYLDQIQQFIIDVSLNNYDDFAPRLEALKVELETYKAKAQPRREIGFNTDDK